MRRTSTPNPDTTAAGPDGGSAPSPSEPDVSGGGSRRDRRTPEIARDRRRIYLRGNFTRVVIWLLVGSTFLAMAIGRLPWWGIALSVLGWILVMFLAIRGRTLIDWIRDRVALLRRRHDVLGEVPGTVIDVDGGGVRQDGFVQVAAIELAADLAETRLAEGRAVTDGTVPVELLAGMMTQYGLDVAIDVVSTGRRVPPGPAYRASYAQGVRFYSAMAERSTWLVLRVDMMRNVRGIAARGPSRTAAPRSLMYAARRLEQRLAERQIRARVLSKDELEKLDTDLLAGAVGPGRERWRHNEFGETFSTSYILDPRCMSTATLDRLWAVDSDNTTVVLQLRKQSAASPVRISGLVRYETDTAAEQIDSAILHRSGVQAALLASTLPGGESSIVELPDVDLSEVDEVQIPIGPAGAVLGVARDGQAIALPFFDGTSQPVSRQVELCADLAVAQVILLRAIGAGASVEVRSSRPEAWQSFARTLADERRMAFAAPGTAPRADITVFDGLPVDVVPPRTVLTLSGRGEQPSVINADAVIVESAPAVVDVAIGNRDRIVGIALAPTDEELRYAGRSVAPPKGRANIGAAPQAPRRTASERAAAPRAASASERHRADGPSIRERLAGPPEEAVDVAPVSPPTPPVAPPAPPVRSFPAPQPQRRVGDRDGDHGAAPVPREGARGADPRGPRASRIEQAPRRGRGSAAVPPLSPRRRPAVAPPAETGAPGAHAAGDDRDAAARRAAALRRPVRPARDAADPEPERRERARSEREETRPSRRPGVGGSDPRRGWHSQPNKPDPTPSNNEQP